MDSPLLSSGSYSLPSRSKQVIIAVIVLIVALAVLSITSLGLSVRAVNISKKGHTQDDPSAQCLYSASSHASSSLWDDDNEKSGKLSDVKAAQAWVLIQHATLWTSGHTYPDQDILINNQGKIEAVGAHPINVGSTEPVVYDVAGAFVTPGLVDMHSHAGVFSAPDDAHATADANEATNPTTPQMRVVDALDPEDPAIRVTLSGGVTTSLILPGSANTIGGEAAYIKMSGKTVQDLLIDGAPRAFKMAAGENPKNVYGGTGKLPMTRMGSIWTMREAFSNAAALLAQQDQWDCQVNAGIKQASPRPFDAALEPLVAMLGGDAYINVHCYQIQDFEAILRLADEFGLRINAFHHALEAWKVPELFVERNITIATFADSWGFKMEAYDGSVHAPRILVDAGVKMAIKSDHPVLDARYLIYQAAKAYHYGLNADSALSAVTSVPADAIGLGARVGHIAPGHDGDVAVWSQHALTVGAVPSLVFIEGRLVVNQSAPATPSATLPVVNNATFPFTGASACASPPQSASSYAIVGVDVWAMTDAEGALIENANIVVINGTVACVGLAAACPITAELDNTYLFTGLGAVATPGLINSGSDIGLMDVEQEDNTYDGFLYEIDDSQVFAADGLKMGNRHLSAAWSGGVTTQIARPLGASLVAGVSVAFTTYGDDSDAAIVQTEVALHINLGNNAKIGGALDSVSGQISLLRSLFQQAEPQSALGRVQNGSLPVAVHVNQADEIAAILRLRRSVMPDAKMIIVGGAEAALMARTIAADGVDVVLSPLRSFPMTFETLRAPGLQAPGLLLQAGVEVVAQAVTDAAVVRDLRWEAGMARAAGLTTAQALASVTSSVAQAYGLQSTGLGSIQVGAPANLAVFLGDPLAIESTVALVAVGGIAQCKPVQY